MDNKNLPLIRFIIIFVILIIVFGYLAYRFNGLDEWWGILLFAIFFAIRINNIFSPQKIKDPRKPIEPRYKQYDENRYPDRDMERIYEAYNIPKEEMEEDSEQDVYEIDEDLEEIENEYVKDKSSIIEADIYSTEENEYESQKWFLTPTGFSLALAGLWLIVSVIISIGFVEVKELINDYFPFSFFIFIPIFFLIGLSGVFGILFIGRDNNELNTQENASFVINMIKILASWGIGIYIVIRYYFL